MADYTYESGAFFPSSGIMPLTHYLDATNEIAPIINQIKLYQAQGEFEKIQALLDENPIIKRYVFGTEDINRLEEELRNTEIYSKNVEQQIFYQPNSPAVAMSVGDVWIGD